VSAENARSTAEPHRTEHHEAGDGVKSQPRIFGAQDLREAIGRKWISVPEHLSIPPGAIQPASLDLSLGKKAWRLKCSFLPDAESTVEEKVESLAFDQVDLRDEGAVLERDRPYLIPLREELRLPPGVRAKANPKSSTGRLDVFTRVITDRNNRFDEIHDGYRGKLYLEVVSRSFAVKVRELLSLNQLRLIEGDPRIGDEGIRALHREFPLLFMDKHALPESDLSVSDGLFLSLDLHAGPAPRMVGYKAKRTSDPIDLTSRGNEAADYWDPVYLDRGSRLILEPEVFYLLLSAERICVPPDYAAEMLAYDPTAGELRTHYAGFFDPGFGYDPERKDNGSKAALEVRARDVPFMVEHRQPICKLAFEQLGQVPDVLYGTSLGSNYQGQETMLSKHFKEQTAGVAQMELREDGEIGEDEAQPPPRSRATPG